jgi:hypothetical protein
MYIHLPPSYEDVAQHSHGANDDNDDDDGNLDFAVDYKIFFALGLAFLVIIGQSHPRA